MDCNEKLYGVFLKYRKETYTVPEKILIKRGLFINDESIERIKSVTKVEVADIDFDYIIVRALTEGYKNHKIYTGELMGFLCL